MITRLMVEVIVDDKMASIKKMKKKDLVALCRELLTDNILEMDDYSIHDLYQEVTE